MVVCVDRLSTYYMAWLLAIVAVGLFVYNHTTPDPITCWAPAQFTDSHREYTNKVCWESDTYYLPLESTTPVAVYQENKGKIQNEKPIQKLPLILLLQALLMYIPAAVWKVLQRNPAVPLQSLLTSAKHCHSAHDAQSYNHLVNFMGRRFGQHLLDIKANKNNAQLLTLCNNYLTVCHIVTRVLCLVASVVNIPILMSLVDPHDIQSAIVEGFVSIYSLALPKVVLCDFEIRHQDKVYSYVVQCVLEHGVPVCIAAFFVVCFILLSAVNILSVLCAVLRALVGWGKGGMEAVLTTNGIEESSCQQFGAMLGGDGAVIVGFVSEVASDAVAADMITGAYSVYMQANNRQAETRDKDTAL